MLHRMKLVHRDLKLDNCGIDYSDRAKIFDLGLVTSEGSEIKGTIISRAPELFAGGAPRHTRPADVWALGAVLFALKEGGYPFVSRWDVQNRPREGDGRAVFDEKIRSRYLAANAEGELQAKLNRVFPPGPRQVLTRMLAFRPEDRFSADEAQDEFERLLASWLRPAEARPRGDSERVIAELESYLSAVAEDRVALSPRQWQKAAEAVEQLEKVLGKQRVSRLLGLAERVRERRVAGEIA